MKKRSLWMSAAAALTVAAALAGCGSTTYFAGRTLPPSGVRNRVLIAVQNPSALARGTLSFVDAYYDIRYSYDFKNQGFTISGYAGALPVSIQNMPEEQQGAVFGSGDGSFSLVNYAKETAAPAASGLAVASSIFMTRDQNYIFAATPAATGSSARVLTIVDKGTGSTYPLSLPGISRISVNPGGTAVLAFVQNSDYIYYPVKLSAGQTVQYSGGSSTWPLGAVDCQPQNSPAWCLFQAIDPASTKGNILPLKFDRPTKAVFSPDGGTAYILNCGPECGGNTSSVSILPVAPLLFLIGRQSGKLPTTRAIPTIPITGGVTNALVAGSTMYVMGQCVADTSGSVPQCAGPQTHGDVFAGMLTMVDTTTNKITAGPISISDGAPGAVNRMILADDNTLWLAMTKCNNGARAAMGLPTGCLTMFNTSTKAVTMLEPYLGDATGVAAVTDLHKVYVAEGGQVYIYSTVDGHAIDNQYVTVTGTAWDVAYMDGTTDDNNTVY